MSDPIVTRHISPYVAIQGPERELAPVPNPMASFEDTTHAYECGYRDGQKAAQLAAPEVKVKALAQAARELLAGVVRTYRSRNGRQMSLEADDGEKCLIVHSDLIAAIEHALAALEGGAA